VIVCVDVAGTAVIMLVTTTVLGCVDNAWAAVLMLVTTTVLTTMDGPSMLVGSATVEEEVTSLELATVELADLEAESVVALSIVDDEVELGSIVTTSVTITTSVFSAEDDNEVVVASTVIVTTSLTITTPVSSAEDDETLELSKEDSLVEVV
jgi:hypothetical protein